MSPKYSVHYESLRRSFIVQGWSSVIPIFSPIDFVSFYVEIPIIAIMFIAWMAFKRPAPPPPTISPQIDARTSLLLLDSQGRRDSRTSIPQRRSEFHDLVDMNSVNLYIDEYEEEEQEVEEDEVTKRLNSKGRLFWSLYYWLV